MARKRGNRQQRKAKRGRQNQPSKSDPSPASAAIQITDANKVNAKSSKAATEKQGKPELPNRRQSLAGNRALSTFFAGAVAVFALAQVVVSKWQWDAMNTTTKQTQAIIEQMQLEQRPWIGIETNRIDEIKDKITGWITFKNFGSNPAFIYNSRMIAVPYDIDDKDLAEIAEVHPDQPEKDFSQIVIPPGQEFDSALTSKMVIFGNAANGNPLPPDYTKEVADGKRPYYVLGAIFYRDANDTKHVTGFCLIYDKNIKQLRQFEKYNYMK